jgi:UDP-2,4-diacetamido-2,4,6-trideoxy-beta-L-altropyranose hydrolase
LAATVPGATCHLQTAQMQRLMQNADLSIGAGGSTTWERCRSGLPSIAIAVSENQVAPSQALAEAGYISFLGRSEDVSVEAIQQAVESMMRSPDKMKEYSALGLHLVDGQGVARVVEALQREISRS